MSLSLKPAFLTLFFIAITAPTLLAQTAKCECDLSNAESLKARECSLCVEAEKQSVGNEIFFLKDVNPRKPNRWLALPKAHAAGWHRMADLPADVRTKLWTSAIAKAQEMFPDAWGLAINSDRIRTQCHTHLHMGRLLPGVETSDDSLLIVSTPAEIPVPDADGLWVHPAPGGKLHVHRGEKITETVLLR